LTVVVGFGAGTAGEALAVVFDARTGGGAGTAGTGTEGTFLAFDAAFGSTRVDVFFAGKDMGFGFNAGGTTAALLDGRTSSSKKSFSPDLRKEKKPAPPLLSGCASHVAVPWRRPTLARDLNTASQQQARTAATTTTPSQRDIGCL
jgi:hypothetical protein